MRLIRRCRLLLVPVLLAGCVVSRSPVPPPQSVIVDTDIGDDIDDAFAVALVLRSPSFRLNAVSASFGDTAQRARLLDRVLAAAGRGDVPVLVGPSTRTATAFTQSAPATGDAGPRRVFPDAVDGLLGRLRAAPPGSITLIALAPLTTVAAMIARDPVAFRRLRQVVMMGGWIAHGYPPRPGQPSNPEPEYNVAQDPGGLRALLGSGVRVWIMPLDATSVPLRPQDEAAIFGRGDSLGRELERLRGEWRRASPYGDHPTLFDVVPVAWLLQPSVCTPEAMHLDIGKDGSTRREPGPANAFVCLSVDAASVQTVLDRALATP